VDDGTDPGDGCAAAELLRQLAAGSGVQHGRRHASVIYIREYPFPVFLLKRCRRAPHPIHNTAFTYRRNQGRQLTFSLVARGVRSAESSGQVKVRSKVSVFLLYKDPDYIGPHLHVSAFALISPSLIYLTTEALIVPLK
jgi:hypothetical protein